ncbi:MAG: hypothetical protein KBD31_05380, partial [Proteobacteria bacterium]|nr:hypothetical protein [Pseudomonadota bacterium]
ESPVGLLLFRGGGGGGRDRFGFLWGPLRTRRMPKMSFFVKILLRKFQSISKILIVERSKKYFLEL